MPATFSQRARDDGRRLARSRPFEKEGLRQGRRITLNPQALAGRHRVRKEAQTPDVANLGLRFPERPAIAPAIWTADSSLPQRAPEGRDITCG